MAHLHHKPHSEGPGTPPSPYVEVTILFRDVLKKPIEGLSVQVKAGTGAPAAPAWRIGPDNIDDPQTGIPASAPNGAAASPAASVPMVDNKAEAVADRDGYAATIHNAARNQPMDVLVKNRHGEYVLKATVTPTKDISAFTVSSPEVHIEATTQLTPKQTLEQDINVPVVKQGEVMTIERLVHEFGPFIGWSQVVTEQGRVKKDFPEKHKEVTTDEQTGKQKTKIAIEHHYKVVDNGKPHTVLLNLLGSRLNYPSPITFSEEQYKKMATELNVDVAAIKAIVMQECGGVPFEANGLPKIRYERHRFYDLLRKQHENQEAE
ncbi:N-acetylmuramidase domain-containing protein [Paraburkholderia sp. MPAMCS5]|nr:N-acetylmuramidase domain-containing protein [Paraburkholderia sp. MPAMCS5]